MYLFFFNCIYVCIDNGHNNCSVSRNAEAATKALIHLDKYDSAIHYYREASRREAEQGVYRSSSRTIIFKIH